MQNLKVTLIQADQVWQDKGANLKMYESYFNELEQTDLILLPEMFHTGFSMDVGNLGEDWENSIGKNFLIEWSIKLNAAIYTSLIIRENGKNYNRGIFVKPDGKVEIYNKRKLFGLGKENEFYTPGTAESIINYGGWKFNLQICYDLRFPELIRNRIIEDGSPAYDVLLYVANWPEKRVTHWEKLLAARAIENQCYVLGVNRVGIDGNFLEYSGSSMIFDALGQLKSSLLPNEIGAISFELESNQLIETRKNLPFLCDF